MRTLKIATLSLLLLAATSVWAITLSPLYSEGKLKVGKKAAGEFSVTNDDLQEATVIIEPHLVTGTGGKLQFKPLDPSIATVELDRPSVRIGVHQRFVFDYTITPHQLPVAVAFIVRTNFGHTNTGAQIVAVLPQWAYLCGKPTRGSCRDSILQAWGIPQK